VADQRAIEFDRYEITYLSPDPRSGDYAAIFFFAGTRLVGRIDFGKAEGFYAGLKGDSVEMYLASSHFSVIFSLLQSDRHWVLWVQSYNDEGAGGPVLRAGLATKSGFSAKLTDNVSWSAVIQPGIARNA
jgi:hypothetical protein